MAPAAVALSLPGTLGRAPSPPPCAWWARGVRCARVCARVTPIDAASDDDYITLKFPTGLWIEPIAVRRVWSTGLTAGIEIHGYTK